MVSFTIVPGRTAPAEEPTTPGAPHMHEIAIVGAGLDRAGGGAPAGGGGKARDRLRALPGAGRGVATFDVGGTPAEVLLPPHLHHRRPTTFHWRTSSASPRDSRGYHARMGIYRAQAATDFGPGRPPLPAAALDRQGAFRALDALPEPARPPRRSRGNTPHATGCCATPAGPFTSRCGDRCWRRSSPSAPARC